ncbi:MAG: hypothetical protein ABI885_12085 [Gammaproteobacteria bacterium]
MQTVIIKTVPVTKGSPATAAAVTLSNITLVPATPYTVNVDSASAVTPRGARVGFYQTISVTGELPYLIEERPVDPVTGMRVGARVRVSIRVCITRRRGFGIRAMPLAPLFGSLRLWWLI